MKENDKDDKLEQLFHQMKWNEPSELFEQRLMQRIQVVAQKKQKVSFWMYWSSLVAACLTLLIGSGLALYFIGIENVFAWLVPLTKGNTLYLVIALPALVLVLISSIARARLYKEA